MGYWEDNYGSDGYDFDDFGFGDGLSDESGYDSSEDYYDRYGNKRKANGNWYDRDGSAPSSSNPSLRPIV